MITRVGTSFVLSVPDIPILVPEKARALINGLARDYVQLAAMTIAGYISAEAPRNFGNLAQSFQAYPAGASGGVQINGTTITDGAEINGRVFSTLPQAAVMNDGRRPGYPVSRAGQASIALWVRRKLGLSGKEAQRATYAIVWAIRHRGIRATHFAEKGMAKAEPVVDRIFADFGSKLADGLMGGAS